VIEYRQGLAQENFADRIDRRRLVAGVGVCKPSWMLKGMGGNECGNNGSISDFPMRHHLALSNSNVCTTISKSLVAAKMWINYLIASVELKSLPDKIYRLSFIIRTPTAKSSVPASFAYPTKARKESLTNQAFDCFLAVPICVLCTFFPESAVTVSHLSDHSRDLPS
jgi:hypothetical protein